jgi:Uma2 family endonuclease
MILHRGGEAVTTRTRVTLDDLFRTPEKAELIQGEIVKMPPTGEMPNDAAGAIYASLRIHARERGTGRAHTDNMGYLVHLPHRESFSPDAPFHVGERPGMKLLEGAPIFAAKVRSEHDYGPTAEREMTQKRADYFACGRLVVWDVDLLGDDVMRSYRSGQPYTPTVFRRGDIAHAEPAAMGWTFEVNKLFT